jgi:hypothetical protein
VPREEAEALIKGMEIKGILKSQEHSGDIFYTYKPSEKMDEVT